MAPELFLSKAYSTSVDVFAFGVMLNEMGAREVPWDGYKRAHNNPNPEPLCSPPCRGIGFKREPGCKQPEPRNLVLTPVPWDGLYTPCACRDLSPGLV
jgi:serine/threonine protein kinase